jgi:hypothetical protein
MELLADPDLIDYLVLHRPPGWQVALGSMPADCCKARQQPQEVAPSTVAWSKYSVSDCVKSDNNLEHAGKSLG